MKIIKGFFLLCLTFLLGLGVVKLGYSVQESNTTHAIKGFAKQALINKEKADKNFLFWVIDASKENQVEYIEQYHELYSELVIREKRLQELIRVEEK